MFFIKHHRICQRRYGSAPTISVLHSEVWKTQPRCVLCVHCLILTTPTDTFFHGNWSFEDGFVDCILILSNISWWYVWIYPWSDIQRGVTQMFHCFCYSNWTRVFMSFSSSINHWLNKNNWTVLIRKLNKTVHFGALQANFQKKRWPEEL